MSLCMVNDCRTATCFSARDVELFDTKPYPQLSKNVKQVYNYIHSHFIDIHGVLELSVMQFFMC